MEAADPARVLLVDDDPQVRHLLRRALARQPRLLVVGEASDGAEALRVAADLDPHLIVLDLQMAGMGGADALPLLRRRLPHTKVAILSGDEPSEQVLLGADVCLKKGQPMDTIVARLLALVEEGHDGGSNR